jgi:hypothetical protein
MSSTIIDGLATTGYVDSAVSSKANTADLTAYQLKSEVVTYTGTNGIKVDDGVISISASYLSSDALNGYATESYVTGQVSGKANSADVYTKQEANAAFLTATTQIPSAISDLTNDS